MGCATPRLLGLFMVLVAAQACGYSDPGTGTATLSVQGSLACTFDSMQTDVVFTVGGSQAALTNANITLLDADSRATLHVPNVATQGTYAAVWPGYHRRVEIQIWAEADGLSARIEGPGRHTLIAPRTGATLAAKDPLQVEWATQDGIRADAVTISLGQGTAAHTAMDDRGHDQFAPSELGSGRDTVTVTRSQSITLGGAAPGSRISHSYGVTSTFINAP